MKKLISISCIALLTIAAGCSKFLDKKPISTVSPNNYYNSESEVNSALAGVYAICGMEFMWGGRIPIRHNASTDESFYSVTNQLVGVWWFNYDASDPVVTEMWTYLYTGIERANMLLANIEKTQMDEAKKTAIVGETKFLRAWYYFTLVQYYGGVPLKTEPSSSVNNVDITRTPAADIYAFVEKEMKEAEGMVREVTDINTTERISKSTVRSALARVYLQWAGEPLKNTAKYQDARDIALKVVQSGVHELNPDYKQIYINECQDINDWKECIWETGNWGNNSDANRIGGRHGNENGVRCTSNNDQVIGYAYGFNSTTYKLYHLYEAGDLRRDWAISTYTLNSSGVKANIGATSIYNRNCAKWRREYELLRPLNKNYTPTNFPIIRYADVLLMLAEAENEVNGPAAALEYINMVRRRGYGKPVNVPDAEADLAGLDQLGFRQAIQDERSRELCFEGLRKMDLIRWGIYLTAMRDQAIEIKARASATYQYAALAADRVAERHLLYPIPAIEMSLNKLIQQNPGW
ncbi:RagB/SusD family nutrient uptake outer membrane protein [Chitinophaga alhagiae]|uniref:RagB/SusD family nutrient uptake outer membrane protein n=1 Tax=Chitinophaga alhagiae TaxID=2203219 RepID=A0ABN5LMS9_9BACT|nr:RagB/SusD family nutrient uptake outer membrane protein [Chitinophaga alhagiae]AWO00632.1 RagB/SusD family nutrient uptake outer membrane protein [Chitinophaga alhagiae]